MKTHTLTVLNVWHHEEQSVLLITFVESNLILDTSKEELKKQGIDSLKPGDTMTIHINK